MPTSAPAIAPMLRAFLRALDEAGIRWTLLRPVASLAAEEGDVDVLVEPASLAAVEAHAERLGYVLVPFAPPDVHAATYDDEAGRFVWLHVQGELRLAGEAFPAEDVLAEAVREGEAARPGDGWLLWILLLRALVDTGRLPERHRDAVVELARRSPAAPEPLLARARAHGIDPARAVELAAAADWDGLTALAVHRPVPRRRRARRVARRLRSLRTRRGISVAVVGPDGAGKSTLVEALARDLPLPVLVRYMGLTGGLMPRAEALRVPGLVFAARTGILWSRWLRALGHSARGGIVVYERHTLDAYVPSGAALGPAGRLSRRLQRRVVPLPDLVLLLDASGRTLHERSGEYDADVLERWREAYAALERRVPHLVKLDAERPPDAVRRDAEKHVWRRYGELRGRRAGAR